MDDESEKIKLSMASNKIPYIYACEEKGEINLVWSEENVHNHLTSPPKERSTIE